MAQKTVRLESLLEEMVDRDALTRFPDPFYLCKQFSSYNRSSKTPNEADGASEDRFGIGWFANEDRNQEVRKEVNGGREELVLMEHVGPGVITRIWTPYKRADMDKPELPESTLIRFYFDGSDEPGIEANYYDFVTGQGFVGTPFAYISVNAGVVYLPIPFASQCKVTLDSETSFYHIINYRAYEPETVVKTFSFEEFTEVSETLEEVAELLLEPHNEEESEPIQMDCTLAPGEIQDVDLPSGSKAIRFLDLLTDPVEDDQALRSTLLKITFDGEEAVECPLSDFFGRGIGLHPYQDWFRTVQQNGSMSCRWIMPYLRDGKIVIENCGKSDVSVRLSAFVGDYEWDDRSMHFRANWRFDYPLSTFPRTDWNYIEAEGRGVYVGDTLSLMNPVAFWWGEGDEKIWVDREDFPSHFGTGTEDYYGYAWGGRGTDHYQKPFHAQVLAGQNRTYGYNTHSRTRSLDAIPFREHLQLDMEVWHWQRVEMAYAVTTYWYGSPGVTHNRDSAKQEAALEIPDPPPLTD